MKGSPVFLLLGLALVRGESSAAVCDSTRIGVPIAGEFLSYAGTVDSARAEWPFWASKAAFDFVHGWLSCSAVGCADAVVEGSDTYRFDGIDVGSPVPITIALDAHLRADPCCPSFCKYAPIYEVSMQASSGEHDSLRVQLCPGSPQEWTARIDLTPLAGEEFTVRYRLYASSTFFICPALAYGEARIAFTGVPPGATLVSICHGVEPAVPTRRESWGKLKASYR